MARQRLYLYKLVNEAVLDTATATNTTSAGIGRQPVEIFDRPAAAVVTIAKIIVGGVLPMTTAVRTNVLVVTVNIVTLMHKVATMVTKTAAAMTTEVTVLTGTAKAHAVVGDGCCAKDCRSRCCT